METKNQEVNSTNTECPVGWRSPDFYAKAARFVNDGDSRNSDDSETRSFSSAVPLTKTRHFFFNAFFLVVVALFKNCKEEKCVWIS